MGTYYNDNPLRSAGPLDGTLDLVSSHSLTSMNSRPVYRLDSEPWT